MVADVVDSKLEKARALGADKVVNSKKESIKDMIESLHQADWMW